MSRKLLLTCAAVLLCSAAHATNIYTEYINPRPAKLGSFLVTTFCGRVAMDCGLWVTDGTGHGTREIKPMRNPGFSADLRYFVSAVDRVYIVGYSSADLGHTLFMTDGTPSGTVTVPISIQTETLSAPAAIGKQLIFIEYPMKAVWRTDGSAAGTVKLADLSLGGVNRLDLVTAGDYVYFPNGDAAHGIELWKTDGTAAGTGPVADVVPGTGSGSAGSITAVGDRVFFLSSDGAGGANLMVSDGSAAGTIPLASVGSFSFPQIVASGTTAFLFQQPSNSTSRIWHSDGTPAGTTLVGEFPFIPEPAATNYAALGPYVYFKAIDSYSRLWRTDGTFAGTQVVAPTLIHDVRALTVAGDVLYLGQVPPNELWRTQGTDATSLKLASPGDVYPLSAVGSTLLFHNHYALWSTDGTLAGTQPLIGADGGIPTLGFATATASVLESGASTTVLVQRSGSSQGAVSIRWTTANGTAIAGQHFGTAGNASQLSGVLSWADGDASAKSIVIGGPGAAIPLIDNSSYDPDGHGFSITLSNASPGADVGAVASAAIAIIDDDSVLEFSPTRISGKESAGTATFTVTRTGNPSRAVTVNYVVFSTYDVFGPTVPLEGQLAWLAGDGAPKTISVPYLDDSVPGLDKSFTVLMSGASGAAIGREDHAFFTIEDDDDGFVMEIQDYYIPENGQLVNVLVRRLGSSTRAASVHWTTANGTALAGKDFGTRNTAVQRSGIVSWAAGESGDKLVAIPIMNNGTYEGPRSFTVVLSNPSAGSAIGPPTFSTVNIIDDEVPPESLLSFSKPKYLVMENGGNAILTVIRAPIGVEFASTASAKYSTMPGSALANSDYVPILNGTLSWAAGDSTARTISIPIVDNAVAEALETFTVSLTSTSSSAIVATPMATVTIVDDDDAFPRYGVVPDGWAVPAAATNGWHASNDPGAYEGVFSLRSDAIEDGESAQIEVTRDFAAGNITFRVKVSSEAGFDVLRVFVDGVEKASWSGTTVTGWQMASIPITAGSHTVRWSYEKDASASVGYDAAWIDAVSLP